MAQAMAEELQSCPDLPRRLVIGLGAHDKKRETRLLRAALSGRAENIFNSIVLSHARLVPVEGVYRNWGYLLNSDEGTLECQQEACAGVVCQSASPRQLRHVLPGLSLIGIPPMKCPQCGRSSFKISPIVLLSTLYNRMEIYAFKECFCGRPRAAEDALMFR